MTSSQTLVAIYLEDDRYEARRILGIALYRDPDEKGSPNYTVPLHDDDFTVHQVHEAMNRRILHQRLPIRVVDDPLLWGDLVGSSSLIVEFKIETGRFEVRS